MQDQSMEGKVCLITGANSGIGKVTALGLAKLGATVVMVCRDSARGQAALDEIKAASHSDKVELMLANLSSQASIRHLATDYRHSHDRLDVLVNNAAVNQWAFSKTEDGIETNFAVNHLAPFLLTNLLLDMLKISAPSRIVNVTSSAQSPIHFDDLMGEKHYNAMHAYSQSKMANILFTYELAQRLNGTAVTVNCVDPGIVRTNLGRHFPFFFRIALTLMWPFMATPEKGAETSIYLATSPQVGGITGKYFANKKEARSSSESYDETAAQELWRISAELTKLSLGG